MTCPRLLTALILATVFPVDGGLAQMPPAIAAPGEDIVATFHAEGAQIYECKPGNDGKLAWVFREPIATLLLDDKTVGRHYAGPTWEHGDGSAVTGKAVGNAPRRDGERHSLAQTGRREPSGERDACGCHHRATDQQPWRRRPRRVRSGRRLSQRPLFSRLRFPQRAQITRRAEPASFVDPRMSGGIIGCFCICDIVPDVDGTVCDCPKFRVSRRSKSDA